MAGNGDAAKAVWLGNLPEEATFQELMELGKQVGTPTWGEKTGKNRGYLLFKTPSEATSAIESLNGAYVGDNEIEADKWTGKVPPMKGGIKGAKGASKGAAKGAAKGGKGKKGAQVVYEYVPVYQPQFQKKGKSKGKGKKKDTSKCVWVGNIPEGCTFNELLELGKQAGDAKFAKVFEGKGKGTGLIQFASADEVAGAIEALNGAQIGDDIVEVDVWEKADKTAEE